jgi:hypothetical protein
MAEHNYREPSDEERRGLQGQTNVEALVRAIDQRLQQPTELILVGRASYELGDEELGKKLRETLQEPVRQNSKSRKLILTEDVDCLVTGKTTDEAVNMAAKGQYLAKMADCYLHALTEQTIRVPKGWEKRVEDIPMPGQPLTNLRLKRLDPYDFVISKGSAGRAKDEEFLKAFLKVYKLDRDKLSETFRDVLANPPSNLAADKTSMYNLSKMAVTLMEKGPSVDRRLEELKSLEVRSVEDVKTIRRIISGQERVGFRESGDPGPGCIGFRVNREMEMWALQTKELLGQAVTPEQKVAAIAFSHVRFEGIKPFKEGNEEVGKAILEAQLRQELGKRDRAELSSDLYADAMKAGARTGDLTKLADLLGKREGLAPLQEKVYAEYMVVPFSDSGRDLQKDLKVSKEMQGMKTKALQTSIPTVGAKTKVKSKGRGGIGD